MYTYKEQFARKFPDLLPAAEALAGHLLEPHQLVSSVAGRLKFVPEHLHWLYLWREASVIASSDSRMTDAEIRAHPYYACSVLKSCAHGKEDSDLQRALKAYIERPDPVFSPLELASLRKNSMASWLPIEVGKLIYSACEPRDRSILAQTCRYFYLAAKAHRGLEPQQEQLKSRVIDICTKESPRSLSLHTPRGWGKSYTLCYAAADLARSARAAHTTVFYYTSRQQLAQTKSAIGKALGADLYLGVSSEAAADTISVLTLDSRESKKQFMRGEHADCIILPADVFSFQQIVKQYREHKGDMMGAYTPSTVFLDAEVSHHFFEYYEDIRGGTIVHGVNNDRQCPHEIVLSSTRAPMPKIFYYPGPCCVWRVQDLGQYLEKLHYIEKFWERQVGSCIAVVSMMPDTSHSRMLRIYGDVHPEFSCAVTGDRLSGAELSEVYPRLQPHAYFGDAASTASEYATAASNRKVLMVCTHEAKLSPEVLAATETVLLLDVDAATERLLNSVASFPNLKVLCTFANASKSLRKLWSVFDPRPLMF